jgi:hypothetical protein
MKIPAIGLVTFASMLLIFSPAAIEGKDAGRVGGEPAPMSAGSGMGPMPSGASMGGIQASGAAGTSGGESSVSPGSLAGYSVNGSSYSVAPNRVLQQTSFGTITNYYNWTNYYSYLVGAFDMTPTYFTRFYRNPEPLITPEILKRTLNEPLRLSKEMLDSIDRLEDILQALTEGSDADKKALLERSKRIRELAKQIRNNQTLATIDLRKEEKLYENDQRSALDPEAIERMREMAVDLDRQLRNMYSESSTSTVSVESYKEHSLESLAKGIERVCKSIEYSAKRM